MTSHSEVAVQAPTSYQELMDVALKPFFRAAADLDEFIAHTQAWAGKDYEREAQVAALVAVAAANYALGDRPLKGLQHRMVVGHFARAWEGTDSPVVLRFVESMLDPSCGHLFKTELSEPSAHYLKKKAAEALAELPATADPKRRAHLEALASGKVPFGWKKEKDDGP